MDLGGNPSAPVASTSAGPGPPPRPSPASADARARRIIAPRPYPDVPPRNPVDADDDPFAAFEGVTDELESMDSVAATRDRAKKARTSRVPLTTAPKPPGKPKASVSGPTSFAEAVASAASAAPSAAADAAAAPPTAPPAHIARSYLSSSEVQRTVDQTLLDEILGDIDARPPILDTFDENHGVVEQWFDARDVEDVKAGAAAMRHLMTEDADLDELLEMSL